MNLRIHLRPGVLRVAAAITLSGAVAGALGLYVIHRPTQLSLDCTLTAVSGEAACPGDINLSPGTYHVDTTVSACDSGWGWRLTSSSSSVSSVGPPIAEVTDGRPGASHPNATFQTDFTLVDPVRYQLSGGAGLASIYANSHCSIRGEIIRTGSYRPPGDWKPVSMHCAIAGAAVRTVHGAWTNPLAECPVPASFAPGHYNVRSILSDCGDGMVWYLVDAKGMGADGAPQVGYGHSGAASSDGTLSPRVTSFQTSFVLFNAHRFTLRSETYPVVTNNDHCSIHLTITRV